MFDASCQCEECRAELQLREWRLKDPEGLDAAVRRSLPPLLRLYCWVCDLLGL